MKIFIKNYMFYFTCFFIYLLFISIFYYFRIINYNTLNIINYIFNLLLFLILGYRISKIRKKKGYLNGFFISILLIILFSIICLVLNRFNTSSLVYYLSLILSSMFGGILGVNKKED